VRVELVTWVHLFNKKGERQKAKGKRIKVKGERIKGKGDLP
jgi:hypothetical protein